MSNFVVIIPAAGIGERFNSKLPKQYTSIGDSSILEKTVSKFLSQDYIKKVIISVSSTDSFYQSLNFITNPKVHIVTGGDSRMESVCNAMHEVDSNEFPLTIIHDAVRPFLNIQSLDTMIDKFALNNKDGIVPCIDINDSIRNRALGFSPANREDFVAVQTPQIFKTKPLKESINKGIKDKKFFSDESQALTHYGFDVDFVAGDRENFKISFPEDINLISPFDAFVGRGIDFHRYEYCAGSQITLAGVKIKSDHKIIAHSDGDIIFHALADSLLGAGGFRDIGFYFPDNDKSNFQLDSSKIVSKSLDLLKERGLMPKNIDITVVAGVPKLTKYIDDMIVNTAKLTSLAKENISIKATTSEGLGRVGDSSGIAVYSLVSLTSL